jgi:serine/threonine protein kinase
MRDGSALPQPGDTIAGKYVLERVIGEGGMSVVYGATHRVTGKRFAIKWMLPDETATSGDTVRRFIREAQVAGLFQHPNVVEVYDVGQVSSSFYMVMEWLDGESLAARLERSGAMSFGDVCQYLIPCMHGVIEAHSAGIVHRDLKPANIFLCRAMHHTPERPKVLDFGIAKISKQLSELNSLVTKSGVLIGTPHYLSPEQLRNQPIDHRTDVYALGVIMYQLLSGQLPFPADNFGQLVLEIATGTPIPLRERVPGLPVGVPEVVAKAMAREPADRFQDVRELALALEEVLAGRLPRLAVVEAAGVERSQAVPGSGLSYPLNDAKASTTSRPQSGERTYSQTPSGSRMPPVGRTPSGSWVARDSVQLSIAAAAGKQSVQPRSPRRVLAYAAVTAVLVGFGLLFVSVRMLKPQSKAEKSAAALSQPRAVTAATETATSAATARTGSAERVASTGLERPRPSASPSQALDGTSAEPAPATGSGAPAAKPRRASRSPQAVQAAVAQPSAAPTAADPPSDLGPDGPIDRNPLHMKLQ